MKRIPLLTLLLFCILSVVNAQKNNITIGTGNPDLQFYATGQAICNTYNKQYPNKTPCRVISTTGSIANLKGLWRKRFNLALTQSDMLYFAYRGLAPFQSTGSHTGLRTLLSLYDSTFFIFVRKNSAIKSFRSLKGKRVNIGPANSGLQGTMRVLTKAEGLTFRQFRSSSQLSAPKEASALCQHQVDAIIYVLSQNSPVLKKAMNTCSMRILSLSGHRIKLLLAHGPYHKVIIKKPIPIRTIGFKTLLATLNTLSDRTAREVSISIIKHFDSFKASQPYLQSLSKRKLYSREYVPYHRGARHRSRFSKHLNML